MDSRQSNLHDKLFSRGSATPPPSSQPFPITQSTSSTTTTPPTTTHLDSLFQSITTQQIPHGNSAPATPSMIADDDASTHSAPVSTTPADRQSALLSLLYPAATSLTATRPLQPSSGPIMPQQVPSPPASSIRSGQSPSNTSEAQGKILLEQLMGTAPRSNFSEPAPAPISTLPPMSSPQFQSSMGDKFQPSQSSMADKYHLNEGSYMPQEPPRDSPQHNQPVPQPQQPQQQPQQPPSPRKSMFDFVSPFDALASTSAVKKKPVPAGPASASSTNEDSWTSASLGSLNDPKRKSVENLMDQLTRSQQSYPSGQTSSPTYDPYSTTDEYSQVESQPTPQQQPLHPRTMPPPPPLPPKPGRSASPPRGSPPKPAAQQPRPHPRPVESPLGQAPMPPARREKDGSPGPRNTWKNEGRGKGAAKGKPQTSPSSQPQTIVFDVSQPLDDVQAPRDAVKSTAIALVKQDSVFLPGTTIGATHWIAYAMTKGRVRVISRSSGDRTLLQLPTVFAPSTSVIDMAVYGNRLAGVTSDGGFVVWELPEVITDDVPGRLLLCIVPSADADPLHSVKWHPKQPDTLAVASETKMYLLDLADAARTFRGEPLPQVELNRISQVFSVPSRLVAFDFDVPHFALATISEDSTLTLWNVHDKMPFWTHRVRGDDVPSSLTFIDDGIVIGRRNGTVFQLLSVITKNVLSTFRFVNGNKEDPDMFGHVNYDSRIQTLWVANNRRDSLIALRVGFDVSGSPSGELVRGGFFEQVVEFSGPKPTIHFVILSADADPTGDEAHAACVAAKLPPGDLALVAFSVHSTGVDQVLIRKEWYDTAVLNALAKFPPYMPAAPVEAKGTRHMPPAPVSISGPAPVTQQSGPIIAPGRSRTPPSEELEPDIARDEVRAHDTKGKNVRGKNVAFRDRDAAKEAEKAFKGDAGASSDTGIALVVTKEIKKSEESLHTRIGRLIGKEMDKQHQRLEEARAHEQAEDFNRQEKILKLISTELTRNTTRVVEMAVKAEVQTSVLPALEQITRTEVRAALNEHVGRGLTEFIQNSLPNEIEKLLLRPDISNHFASILSTNLNPLIERYIKDSVTKNIIPTYSQQTSAMHQDILREMRAEILNVKKDSMTWQTEAARSQESLIRELEHSVRMLSDQVKFLSLNSAASHRITSSSSPAPSISGMSSMSQGMHRSQNLPPATTQAPVYGSQSLSSFVQPPQPSQMHATWYPSTIAAPQASHPIAPPQPPPPPSQRSPPAQHDAWEDTYMAVLGTQDPKQLRELLARSSPEVVMPMDRKGPLSMAVILSILHRLATIIAETPPVDEAFKSSLWWMQRTATVLNVNEPLIAPYVARVLPNVKATLNTTKQRLAILPGGPQTMDAARTISEIQDILNRKTVSAPQGGL
ncbi:uncharacterized protein EDB91DRAFT_1112153 [Suillus paluster]|uniref:uncharacterized protein n=1 Tax=Suillus paluster TaxID=48578 RepID=UPI001B8750D5|nr:uncharacterized protein EDB91DRAFT_1112153 [Suillus paluster]KAG1749037.1 hypothetical protein EDB91DRAFT_1112153 [Suillus paluster]